MRSTDDRSISPTHPLNDTRPVFQLCNAELGYISACMVYSQGVRSFVDDWLLFYSFPFKGFALQELSSSSCRLLISGVHETLLDAILSPITAQITLTSSRRGGGGGVVCFPLQPWGSSDHLQNNHITVDADSNMSWTTASIIHRVLAGTFDGVQLLSGLIDQG